MLKELSQLLHPPSSRTLALSLWVLNVLVLNSALEVLNALPATLCKSPLAASTTQNVKTTHNVLPTSAPAVSAAVLCLNPSG